MAGQAILDVLQKTGALIQNSHFVLTSGRHSPLYINKDSMYPHTAETSLVGLMFANTFKDLNIDVVAAPALGGIVLSQWVAHHLSILKKKEILGLYTEKKLEGNQVFKRGYDKLVRGKNVLVVEDLTTTGASVKKVIASVRQHGGNVVAAGVMVNRDPKLVNSKTIGVPFQALGELFTESYDANNCPLCKKGIPVNTDIGHGKQFLEEKTK